MKAKMQPNLEPNLEPNLAPKFAWLGLAGACAGSLGAGWAELGWVAAASVADRVPGWADWRAG